MTATAALALAAASFVARGEDAAAGVARLLALPAAQASEEEVVRDLGRLGAEAVPVLLLCAKGEGHFLFGEGVPSGELAVSPDRVALVAEQALAAMPQRSVLTALTTHLRADRSVEARAAAARILARLGAPEGVDLALLLLGAASEQELAAAWFRQPLLEAFVAPLSLEALALSRLERGLRELDPARLDLVIEALCEAERGDAAGALIGLVAQHRELAPELYEALGTVAGSRPFEAEGAGVAGALALGLADERPEVRSAAARAAGRASVVEVAPALVDALADKSAEVRAAARAALRAMAGVDHGEDDEPWRVLVEAERYWREEDGLDAALAVIAGEDLALACGALRDLQRHGLSRAAIGAELGELLPRLPAPTARTAAATLANLGARTGVPGLVHLSDHAPEDETVGAAHAALLRLTGAYQPLEPDGWRAWLERTGRADK